MEWNLETLIKAGGIYCISLIVFHLLFWKIFHWDKELRRLNALNRAVMQVLNLSLTAAFLIFAFISLAHTNELLSSPLGHSLLGLISAFWLFRAVQQIAFFRLKHWASWVFLGFFLAGAVIYAVPLVYGR